MNNLIEKGKWKSRWQIDKFYDPNNEIADKLRKGAKIEDLMNDPQYLGHEDIDGNLLLNTGINELWDIITGASANVFDTTHAQIGVGDDGTTVASAAQTDLTGSQTTYKAMDTSYPTTTSQQANFRSTFASGDANYHWNEFTIKQDTSTICLNRKLSDKGTKAVGETWTITLTVTLS